MTRNERTSARVAKIAGRILAAKRCTVWLWDDLDAWPVAMLPEDALALAASALTQAPGVSIGSVLDRALRRSVKVVRAQAESEGGMTETTRRYLDLAQDWYRPKNGGEGKVLANMQRRGLLNMRTLLVKKSPFVVCEYRTKRDATP